MIFLLLHRVLALTYSSVSVLMLLAEQVPASGPRITLLGDGPCLAPCPRPSTTLLSFISEPQILGSADGSPHTFPSFLSPHVSAQSQLIHASFPVCSNRPLTFDPLEPCISLHFSKMPVTFCLVTICRPSVGCHLSLCTPNKLQAHCWMSVY